MEGFSLKPLSGISFRDLICIEVYTFNRSVNPLLLEQIYQGSRDVTSLTLFSTRVNVILEITDSIDTYACINDNWFSADLWLELRKARYELEGGPIGACCLAARVRNIAKCYFLNPQPNCVHELPTRSSSRYGTEE